MASNQKVRMKFLQAEINDEYNNGMNHIDISDQLRNTYHLITGSAKGNGGGQSGSGDYKSSW